MIIEINVSDKLVTGDNDDHSALTDSDQARERKRRAPDIGTPFDLRAGERRPKLVSGLPLGPHSE